MEGKKEEIRSKIDGGPSVQLTQLEYALGLFNLQDFSSLIALGANACYMTCLNRHKTHLFYFIITEHFLNNSHKAEKVCFSSKNSPFFCSKNTMLLNIIPDSTCSNNTAKLRCFLAGFVICMLSSTSSYFFTELWKVALQSAFHYMFIMIG